jgi:hypothetical protein
VFIFSFFAMTGSSSICGLIPCSNGRHIFPDKSRTITFDGEIFIGCDENDRAQSVLALIHFYVPSGEADPEDGVLYLVSGKVVSVNAQTPVGANNNWNDYDMVIDAEMVSVLMLYICTIVDVVPYEVSHRGISRNVCLSSSRFHFRSGL